MQRMAGLVAHQREAARQHAAIGECIQQLSAMGNPRRQPLRRGGERAVGALRQSNYAFVIPGDRLALRLRVGQLRRLQADREPAETLVAVPQQAFRRMRDPLAGSGEPLPGLCELCPQHAHGQPRPQAGKVPEVGVRVGLQAAGQGGGGAIQPLGTAPNGTQVADANGSLTTVPPAGALPNSSGRDLTGGLTVEKLLGRWTVLSGTDQCQLNLTQTAKSGTSRYRASAPACTLKSLSGVASWTLAGSQVQLFDDKDNIIAALILSGNRFIGTLSGGQGISMTG